MKLGDGRHFPGPSLHLGAPCVMVQLTLGESVEWTRLRIAQGAMRRLEALLGPLKERAGADGGAGAHVAWLVVDIALALQKRAGYAVELGRVRRLEEAGRFQLAVETEWAPTTVAALNSAVGLAAGLMRADGETQPAFEEDVILEFRRSLGLKGLTIDRRYLLHAARRAGIPASLIGPDVIRFGLGCHARTMYRQFTDATSALAVRQSSDKTAALAALAEAGVPVPAHVPVGDAAAAVAAAARLGWPVVVKPTQTDCGVGVSVELKTAAEVARAYQLARRFGRLVAVESFVPGETFRLLVIGGRFVAAARTAPASVVGDGVKTVRALVDAANRDWGRGADHTQALSWIEPDADAEAMLESAGLGWDAVPGAGREVRLRSASNLSRGGASLDVTDRVHPEFRSMAERAARTIGLDLAGIDLRARAIDVPPEAGNCAVIEINPTPGLRMHHSPASGRGVDVARSVLELLYPPGRASRIPVAAITGTNGKTTTSRLLAHILGTAGYRVGRATTGELAVGDRILATGDCAGPAYARRLFANREVEAAVLETSRGGIIKWGLGFQSCDAAAVLNVADDHIGMDGIADLDQMAAVKRKVADAALGTLVLNAKDARCLAMAKGSRAARVILFSLDPSHPAIAAHVQGGNTAYVIEGEGADASVTRLAGAQCERLLEASAIPIAFEGAARFNLANVAAAMALAEALDVSRAVAREGVRTFQGDFASNPGRLNCYRGLPFKVVLDFAHNAHGMEQVLPVLAQISAIGKRICCFGVNARSHSDDRAMRHAALLAPHFDRFVPYLWDHPRKRRAGLHLVLRQGLLDAGIREQAVRACDGERDAIEMGLDWAEAGDLLVVFSGTDERLTWNRIIEGGVRAQETRVTQPH